MRRIVFLCLTSAAVLFAATAAQAQTPPQATGVSYEVAAGGGSECACQPTCCESSCCDSCCGHWLEGFTLADWLGIDTECYEIGGWTQLGYTDNNIPLSQAYNDLLSFQDVPDHLHLNQQWFYFGKKVNGECGFDLGGRIDVVYGTDAQKTQSFGNPNAGVRN